MSPEQLNRYALKEYNRANKARQREINRANKEYTREVNRLQREQEKAYNRIAREQQRAYNKEVKTQLKTDERGKKLAQSVSSNLNDKELALLGFNSTIVSYAATVIKYGIKYGVTSIDRSFVNKVFTHIGASTGDNMSEAITLYLVKLVRSNKAAELDTALKKVYSQKFFDSSDTDISHASDVLTKHYRDLNKLFGIGESRITNRGIICKSINRLPRLVMVGGIKDPIFEIYNSSRYVDFKDKCYVTISSTSANSVILRTDRKPVLERGQVPKVDGIGEIKEKVINDTDKEGNVTSKTVNIVKLNSKYVKVLNRYAVYASIQKPAEHCGMIEVICSGGNRIYVYAAEANGNDVVNSGEGSKKVIGFGFKSGELLDKLTNGAKGIYNKYKGIMVIRYKPVNKFESKLLDPISVNEAREAEVIRYSDNI